MTIQTPILPTPSEMARELLRDWSPSRSIELEKLNVAEGLAGLPEAMRISRRKFGPHRNYIGEDCEGAIQTPIIPDYADLVEETIAAMTIRRDALINAHREIRSVYAKAFRAADGDLDAINTVSDALYRAMLGISTDDLDIIEQLSEHHRSVRPLDLIQLISDAKGRATSVDLRMQRIQDRQQAAMRGARRREEERAAGNGRGAYTEAYEAAAKLSLAQRRQLAESLLES